MGAWGMIDGSPVDQQFEDIFTVCNAAYDAVIAAYPKPDDVNNIFKGPQEQMSRDRVSSAVKIPL